MRMFLISDNVDTLTGMRLSGIEGVLAHSSGEVQDSVNAVIADPGIGILLITEKLATLCPELVSRLKLERMVPMVIEIPDRHGTGRSPDSITRYVLEAIGTRI